MCLSSEQCLHTLTCNVQPLSDRKHAARAHPSHPCVSRTQAPLLPAPKGRMERKLANADARLKASFAPDSLQHAHAPAQGPASMQVGVIRSD